MRPPCAPPWSGSTTRRGCGAAGRRRARLGTTALRRRGPARGPGDLVFTPSAAEAALIGRLSAQARFFDSRARYCQAEYEQRAVDRRTAWQQLLAERDELAQRYEDCGRIWEDDAAGRAAAPDQVEPGHAPCYFTATPRSMEELASW